MAIKPNSPTRSLASADGKWAMERLQQDFPSLTREGAAGIVGNLHHECGGFKTLQEIKPVVKGSRGGYGWAQWTGPRRREFEAWAAKNNLKLDSRAANYGFLKHELTNTSERRVIAQLAGVKDVSRAADIFSNVFLRPGTPHLESRRRAARYYLEA
jgi:hypothetical protein